MRISELARRTGVPKETIHYYVREGVLRKPRKVAKNVADYDESYVDQIRTIKGLQDNYFLPLTVIKKIIRQRKKQPLSEQASFRFQSEYFKPLDHLLTSDVQGREAFRKATGLGRTWLDKMEKWHVLSPTIRDGQPVYSADDVAIGKLLVAMDRLGYGPKDGHDPEDLRHVGDFLRSYIKRVYEKYYETDVKRQASRDFSEADGQMIEMMSSFFYHFYRRSVMEERECRRKVTEERGGEHPA
jgi:DNA-binding transcriptional MerR regulator